MVKQIFPEHNYNPNDSDLRKFRSDSLTANSLKLRNELRSVLNEIIENQKKEWAAYKLEIDNKLSNISAEMSSCKIANEERIAEVNEKFDRP